MTEHLFSEVFDENTRWGLFLKRGGIPFWVLDTCVGKTAIQLQDTDDAPAFSSVKLGTQASDVGISLGPVELSLGAMSPYTNFRGKAGVMSGYREKIFIKTNLKCGRSASLQIIDYCLFDRVLPSIFYDEWSLVHPTLRAPLFQCPFILPQLRPFSEGLAPTRKIKYISC